MHASLRAFKGKIIIAEIKLSLFLIASGPPVELLQ